jgi:hypothetical protein
MVKSPDQPAPLPRAHARRKVWWLIPVALAAATGIALGVGLGVSANDYVHAGSIATLDAKR